LGLNLGAVLIDRVLRLPVRFFASYASGDLADRLRGIEAIGRTLTGTTVVALLAGIFSSLNLVLLLWIDVRLALACTGLLVAGAAVSFGFHLVALRWERVAMRERGRLDGFVVQLVIGMTKLRTAAAERRALRVWARGFADLRDAVGRAQATQTGQQVFSAMLPLAVLALLFAGAVQLGTGSAQAAMSLGDFMVFSAALGNLLAALLTLSVELANVMRVVPLYERALPLLNAAPESDRPVTAGVSAMRAGGLQGEIELVDVSFRYDPAAPWALQEVSLRIAAGEMVAIVGTSGSGKSTILRLLLGFERPERGTVLLDGTPLDQFDLGLVRRGMGVVLQQSRLSPGNIFQNIVGHTGMNLDAAWEAARQASLAEDIEAMPMGMHTTVMENGQGLSGGQCQRLAIARALVARPRIILLDEATSALDNRTQDVVGRSLVGIAATRVVIAHRLSTIERADRILVMEEGRLVQSGTFDALMAEPGRFRELAARQML
jgi:ATP-binding cassette subfamily C protein